MERLLAGPFADDRLWIIHQNSAPPLAMAAASCPENKIGFVGAAITLEKQGFVFAPNYKDF